MGIDHPSEDLRLDTDANIKELEWFATRKVNLAGLSGNGPEKETWADVMLSDLADLRKALAAERNTR